MTASPPDTAARWFVRAMTVVLCGAAGWLVWTQGGATFPEHDEWELLAKYVDRPDLGEWAFAHHSEHRYPLAKLLWLGSVRTTGYNFKAPMFVTLGLLTAAAVLLQWAARRVRGRAHPLDALSAVLLLHWGHAFNLLMGYQVGFALVAYAVAGWVWCAAHWNATRRSGWAFGGGVFVAVLIVCGGFGLAFTPPAVGWLGYTAVVSARGRRWGSAAGLGLLAAGVCGYSGWVVLTMPPLVPGGLDPVRQPGELLAATAAYLSGGLGYWDWELDGGPLRWGVTLLVLAVYVSAVMVTLGWVRQPALGRRALGVAVLLVLGGVVTTAVLAARARGMIAVLGERFTTPSAAGLAVALFALAVAVRTRPRWSVAWAVVVVAVAAGVFWLNRTHALRVGYYSRLAQGELKADLLAGEPPVVLAGRHSGTCGVGVGDPLADRLVWFKRAGIGVFRQMSDDPPFTTVPVEGVVVPFDLGSTDANSPVPLPAPPPGAFAVRWRTTTVRSGGWSAVSCRWTDPATGEPRRSVAHPTWPSVTAWLVFTFAGRPTDLRVEADDSVDLLRVERMEWLVSPP